MINRDELLNIALDCDFEHFASEDAEWLDCSIDDLVSFANAILERAAVECERSEMYRGSIFAARIRKLKEPQE